MNLAKYGYLINFATSLTVIILSWQNHFVLAQINPDSTLEEESSQVNSTPEQITEINGGAIRGTNLFHSFREFNVNESEIVNFTNPDGVTNIFSRVTGNKISQILGDLEVSGDANLFLINPNGIVFGEKASLNLNGSFVATTANSVNFADGNQFVAQPTNAKPLLTINLPIGLQFGNQPGKIINQAQSPQKAASNNQVNNFDTPAGLLVQSNQTLALIGGEIILEGGNLTALGGNIELGSVDSNSLVNLNFIESGITFDYQAVQNFLDITLTNRAGFVKLVFFDDNNQPIVNFQESPVPSIVDGTSEQTTGKVNLFGKNINIYNGSQIQTPTFEAISGGTLTINAQEQLTVSGSNPFLGVFPRPSALISSTVGDGNAGDIQITTKKLIIQDSGNINNSSSQIFNLNTGEVLSAKGNGGTINIVASEFIKIANQSTISSDTSGVGTAGNINLKTGNLLLDNKGEINVSSDGTGDAGNIFIQAESLEIKNESLISAATKISDGGNIILKVNDNLELRNQSKISASVGGAEDGGNINIATKFLITSPQDNSDLTANAELGRGGNITIETLGIFGISFQETSTGFSEITVSSNFGLDGTFKLLNYDLQPSKTEFSSQLQIIKLTAKFSPDYCYISQQNKYIKTGRGGIPLASKNSLIPEYTWEDWRILNSEYSEPVKPNHYVSSQASIIPINSIQGWIVNQQGEIVLTKNPIMVTPHPPATISSGC